MIVILGAMDSEIGSFLSVMDNGQIRHWNGFDHHQGTIEGRAVLVSKSGVGKVMAAMMTQHLIDDYRPLAVLFTGLAGSLQPQIGIGDTLVARDLVQHDMETSAIGFPRGQIPFSDWRFIPADPRLLHLASDYEPALGKLHVGRICTGDQFISHREMSSHGYLAGELAGDGVEMEGASVAQVCAVNNVPCLVARTISDKADGSAAVNFEEFLPRASHNSLDFIRYMLPQI
ncbi:MAG: 5-methylthioadenosine/S-adenosylhomocysteine nucleosidase [Proteobacteria bacterium]|nr:5-methylthioadenosine/S-adenosylhomocysteine nucleosidase [Pseudomonadota bacterium]